VTRRLAVLIGGSLAVWLVLALPARAVWGDGAVAYSAAALGLCLVPAVLTLLWAGWAYSQPADKQLTMVLGGTGVRLLAVAGGAFALVQFVPYFRNQTQPGPGFLTWLLVFYPVTLAMETVLVVVSPRAERAPSGSARSARGDT